MQGGRYNLVIIDFNSNTGISYQDLAGTFLNDVINLNQSNIKKLKRELESL